MPERAFWHEQSPRRLHALFDAYFGAIRSETRENGPQKAGGSLLAYVQGGE